MSAKDTLKKIADALGVSPNEKANTEPIVEAAVEQKEAPAVEKKEEPNSVKEIKETKTVEKEVETPKTEVDADKTTEIAKEEVENKEEVKEPVINKPSELDLLKDQVNELKKLIAENKVPEVEEEPKGLVHNPEAGVSKRGQRIGNKGGDITSRVYKYINR